MKARSKLVVALTLLVSAGSAVAASISVEKRTILTSGEKVHPIHYQLGQSTVIYFGFRPETVICGNKNYFNIEKIKDGLTIQPLSGFSTNLTVLAEGKRFLFFLTPARRKADGFIEAKWIPLAQVRVVEIESRKSVGSSREIGRKIKLAQAVEFTVLREKSVESGGRRIFELELRNGGVTAIPADRFEVVAFREGILLERQVLVWQADTLKGKARLRGRVIISEKAMQGLSLVVGYRGKSSTLVLKGGRD